jgi:hypothetical protein
MNATENRPVNEAVHNAGGKFACINQYIVTGNAAGQPHINSRVVATIDDKAHPLAKQLVHAASTQPDLLAACEQIEEWLEPKVSPDSDTETPESVALGIIRAAIAHATP